MTKNEMTQLMTALSQMIQPTLDNMANQIASLQARQIARADYVTTSGDDPIDPRPLREAKRSRIPTLAPKSTSPERKANGHRLDCECRTCENIARNKKRASNKTDKKQARKTGAVVRRDDPFTDTLTWACETVIANTRNKKRMPFNEKLTVLIDNDPRPFLGPEAYKFRKAYKNAGLSYRDAATMLLETLESNGWEYPA